MQLISTVTYVQKCRRKKFEKRVQVSNNIKSGHYDNMGTFVSGVLPNILKKY